MRRVTFENARGESIVFYLSPLLITSLTGIGEVTVDTQTQKSPYQDGETYIDTLLHPRYPTLEGAIIETDLQAIKDYRKNILKVCNPKLGLGKLTLELDGDTKEILATLDGAPVFPERGTKPYQNFIVNFACPYPYWQSIQQDTDPLSAIIGLWQFPLHFPMRFGQKGDYAIISNDGDVPCPIEIEFNGPVTNPVITNVTTGKMIKVNQTINDGEKLYINTSFGNKKVEIVQADGTRTNAYHYIDIFQSELFLLDVGDNEIQYSADGGVSNATVTITYRNYYVGV